MTTAIITRPNCYLFIHCKYKCSSLYSIKIRYSVCSSQTVHWN